MDGILVRNNPLSEEHRFVEILNANWALSDLEDSTEYVVDNLIPTKSLSIFFGEPGSKKTYSAISLAVSVAAGLDNWLGFHIHQCPVLFIDEESGRRRFTTRIASALRGISASNSTPICYLCLSGFNLIDLDDQVRLMDLIRWTNSRLVFIDALAEIMDGDENSKKDTHPILMALRSIAESTGAAIVLIHHSGKSGDYRGSSAIMGAVDLMIQVESKNKSKLIRFITVKNRDGEPVNWSALATWEEDQFYLTETNNSDLIKEPSLGEKFVLSFLTKNGPTPLPNIIEAADICKPNVALKAVYSLAKKENIRRINPSEKGQGVKAIYGLVEKDNQMESK
jgi:hypothetical protein